MVGVSVTSPGGWGFIIATLAFVFYPLSTVDMTRLRWYSYGLVTNEERNTIVIENPDNVPLAIKRTNHALNSKIWLAWTAAYCCIAISMLSVGLNMTQFGDFAHSKGVDVILALAVVTVILIKSWQTTAAIVDKPALDKNVPARSQVNYYYYKNRALRIALPLHAFVLALVAIANLAVISSLFLNNTPNIVLVTFWTLTTNITIGGFFYTLYALNVWIGWDKKFLANKKEQELS